MCKLNAHRNLGPLLDGILRNLTGIGRGSAGGDDDAVDLGEFLETGKLIKLYSSVRIKATHQGVANRLWLVCNLLGHKRWPAAL